MGTLREWGRKLRRTASAFRADDSGNVAIMSFFTIIPMILLMGGSIDLWRLEMERKRVQSVLDRGVLAAARVDHNQANGAGQVGVDQIKAIVTSYAAAQGVTLPPEPATQWNIRNERDNGYRRVEVASTFQMPTTFFKMLDRDTFELEVASVAEEQKTTVEVSLVLDISGSMASYIDNTRQSRRIDEMKTAAGVFVDALLPSEAAKKHTSISLVPYTSSVSMGRGMFNYLRGGARDHEHSSCVYFTNADYSSNNIPNFRSRTQVEHFVYYTHRTFYNFNNGNFESGGGRGMLRENRLNNPQIGHSTGNQEDWDLGNFTPKGGYNAYFKNRNLDDGLEYGPFNCPDDPHAYMLKDYVTTDVAAARSSGDEFEYAHATLGNIRVEHDELFEHVADCEWTSLGYRKRSRGRWRYRIPNDSDGPREGPGRGSESHCRWHPSEARIADNTRSFEQAVNDDHVGFDEDDPSILYFSNDDAVLKDRINRLGMHQNTSTQMGMKWAEILLNPAFRGSIAGAAGAGVIQLDPDLAGRPYDYDKDGNSKFIVLMTDGRITSMPRKRTTEFNYNAQGHNSRTYTGTSTAVSQFNRVCARVKEARYDIQVFTIGFALGSANDATKTQLRNCASSPAHYKDVDDPTQLRQAFLEIAASINTLRLRSTTPGS